MGRRFRGYLPVVVDVETGGFNAATDALLEISAVTLRLDARGHCQIDQTLSFHVHPFPGANLEPASLQVTGIDPDHPLRPALPEREALGRVFREVRRLLKETGCHRAILTGHNAAFDLAFLNAAVARCKIKRNPFHPFSCFDTVTLAGVAVGQTVLAKAMVAAGHEWDNQQAHSATYDAQQTAALFCTLVNRFEPVYTALTNADRD